MTDAEIFIHLCYFDPRHPGAIMGMAQCRPCHCPNCFKGTTMLAEEVLRLKAFILGQTTGHTSPSAPQRPKKLKVYLSGPITGMEETAKATFSAYEQKFKELGFEALNPFNFNHDHDKTWESYMEVCLKELENADLLVLLPGWRNSKGANVERLKALKNNIPVKSADQLLIVLGPDGIISKSYDISRLLIRTL